MALRRGPRRALAVAGAVLALLAVAAAFGLPKAFDGMLAAADGISRSETGLPLTFAKPPSLSLFPLGASFEGVRWGDDASDLSVSAKSGRATASLSSLVAGTPEFDEIVLESPVVRYREAPARKEPRSASLAVPEEKAASGDDGGSARVSFSLGRLVLHDGLVVVERADGDTFTLSNVNLSVRGIREGGSGDVECDFAAGLRRVSGEWYEATLALKGGVALTPDGVDVSSLEATLTPLSGLYARELGPASLKFSGSADPASGKLAVRRLELALPHARAEFGGAGAFSPEPSFEGTLSLEADPAKMGLSPSLAGVGPLTLGGKILLKGETVELPDLEAKVGEIAARASLSADVAAPAVAGSVTCSAFDAASFLPKDGEKAAQPAPKARQARKEGEGAAEETAWPKVDLALHLDGVAWKGAKLTDVEARIGGEDGLYSVSGLKAAVDGSGSIEAQASVSAADASWKTSGKARKIAISTAEKIAGRRLGISGSADADWTLSGQGTDGAAVLETASGSGTLILRSLVVDALKKASGAAGLVSSYAMPDRIERVTIPFELKDGKCRFTADVRSGSLGGTGRGTLDLVRSRVDSSATLKIKGRGVPLTVSGPLSDVSVAVDTERLLKEGGRDLLEAPEAVVDDIGKVVPKKLKTPFGVIGR